jgi:quinol monooxygenase YgiN
MTVQIVRATTKPGHAADLEAAAAKVFAALGELQPGGLRYASLRVAEDSYLILLEVEDGAENPLPSMAAFQEFQAGLRGWLSGAPVIESASVVGSYRVL